MERVDKVKKWVESQALSIDNHYGEQSYSHHIQTVVNIIDKNCEKYGANKELALIAGYMHDYASIRDSNYTKDHHIIGVGYAYDILKSLLRLELTNDELMLIMDCIFNHRGSIPHEKLTPEEKCIADSDALAHIFEIPSIFRLAFVINKLDIKNGTLFVVGKLANSYEKLSPIGIKLAENQYKAARMVIDRTQQDPIFYDRYTKLQHEFNLPKLIREQYVDWQMDVDEGAWNVLKRLKNVFLELGQAEEEEILDHFIAIQKVLSRQYKAKKGIN